MSATINTRAHAMRAKAAVPRRHPKRRAGRLSRYILLGMLAAAFLAPLYIIISASLKPPAQAGIGSMWQLPEAIDFSGLANAWSRLAPNILNSLIVVVPATILSCFLGSLNGFLLAKVRFRFSNTVFILMLFGMYIPFQAVLVPLVQFLESVSLYGTLTGLILVHVIYGLGITTLVFRNYYAGVPTDLIEAASIDGAGLMSTYLRVFIPLSAPGFVVCGVFQFTNIWNDFLFGLVVVPNSSKQPVTVALNNLQGTTSVDWNVVMSGALIAAVPTIIVYLVLGRFFIRGLLAGSYR